MTLKQGFKHKRFSDPSFEIFVGLASEENIIFIYELSMDIIHFNGKAPHNVVDTAGCFSLTSYLDSGGNNYKQYDEETC